MPRAIDPSYRFAVVLDSDADKPEATRPTFWFRAATAREWGRFTAALDADETRADAIGLVLSEFLVDWRLDESHPFDPKALLDVVTMSELAELTKAVASQATLDSAQKKQSTLPDCSSADSSAATVETPAKTDLQSASQP